MLSNGAIATYDAAASSSSGHILVFDYTVGGNDHSPALAITNVNPNGANIQDANGHSVDFSRILNHSLALQINPSPLTVSSVTPSQTGEIDAGQQVQLTLTMSETFTDQFVSYPTLTLNDGATARGSFSGNQLIFNYLVGSNDHTSNLQITSVNLNGTTVQDANGFSPNFSSVLNVNTGVQIGRPLYVTSVASSVTGEADAGQMVRITLAMSEAVNLSGGPPSLTLSDNATASYDSALSNLANGLLVFDYAVGNSDHSPNLEVSAVNLNGGTVQDGSGQPADFSAALDKPSSLQISASPVAVSSVSASPGGQVSNNQDVLITVQMNGAISSARGDLQLNDGGTAFFDSADSILSAGKLVFDYAVGNSEDVYTPDRTLNLAVTGATAVANDANGYSINFAGAFNVGLGVQVGPASFVSSVLTNSQALEADSGQSVQIVLSMSEPVVVNTLAGSPTLALNDGGAATYDAAASNPSGGRLVFDYTVGINDRAKSLAISDFNLNGATVQDSGGHNADFTVALGQDVNVAIGSSLFQLQIGPATVVAVASSQIGEVNAGQQVNLEIDLNSGVTVDTSGGSPKLILNDGAIATYDSALSDLSAGALLFDYAIGPNEHTPELEIASVTLNGAVIQDYNGSHADFSGALNVRTNIQVAASIGAKTDDVLGSGVSDVLFRNDASGDTGFYAMKNGVLQGWHDIAPSSTAYEAIGTGDFNADGTADILFRNESTGDTGFYLMNNGLLSGWHDIGASSTAYAVAGLGDFIGNGTSDVLFRNNATGDTGFYAISNGVNNGWHDIGASSTAYDVVGVGDFTGSGTDDILFRNNATGDTGFYQMANGVLEGWHDIGASSTAYSVVGIGDFTGSGTDDILFRNNATGDTGFYQIVNGSNSGWHSLGATSTAYSVVAVGDYNADGASDILFRSSGGDTGFYAMANGVNTGWHDIGPSSTAYHVLSS
jgi:hypothetical protein